MKPHAPSRAAIIVLVPILSFLASCHTPEEAVAWADERAADRVARKQEELFGEVRDFDLSGPGARVMADVVDPETGVTRADASLDLDLATILEIAATNSRDFQSEKERLWRAALSYVVQEERFRPSPFATTTSTLSSNRGTESVSAGADIGFTEFLESGGSYAVSIGLDFLRFLSSPSSESLGSIISLDITLPFLRNAGREIATENLVQADRNVLYALRDFERFKQTYSVGVISAYLRALGQSQRVENEQATVRSLELSRLEAEAKYEEGRFPLIEVDQNRQAELRGRDRVVRASEGLERSLDNLKDLIGLPVDLEVALRADDLVMLEQLVEAEASIEGAPIAQEDALKLALTARLDFRTAVDSVADAGRRVVLAENALDPSLDLALSATPASDTLFPLAFNLDDGTYSARVDYDLALDRDVEKVGLRNALLDLDAALRSQEDFRERTKIEVREALRSLRQSRESYRIAQASTRLAEVRLRAAQDLLREGRAQTRDFLEAQDALLASQNDLVDTRVEYRIAFLELLRDTGVLVVAPGGLDHEATRDLLAER